MNWCTQPGKHVGRSLKKCPGAYYGVLLLPSMFTTEGRHDGQIHPMQRTDNEGNFGLGQSGYPTTTSVPLEIPLDPGGG